MEEDIVLKGNGLFGDIFGDVVHQFGDGDMRGWMIGMTSF